jgi:hypothetical protein
MQCKDLAERLAAYHYRDLEPDELGSIEAHLEACAACRAALEAVRETAAGLDALPVPAPSELDWARFEARLEARVAPLRAERLAARASARPLRWRTLGRVAAAVAIGGLSALSVSLYFQTRELTRQIGSLQHQHVDLLITTDPRATRTLPLTDEQAALLDKLGPDGRPVRLYSLARMEIGDRQRKILSEFLANFPRHVLADEVFAALRKQGDATPRPLDVAVRNPIRIVMPPLPGQVAQEHFQREIARLKGLAVKDGDSHFNDYARFRAARVAEEELGDRERAESEYKDVVASAAPGAIRDAAEERVQALGGHR